MHIWQRPEVIEHTQRLLRSYRHWMGRDLLPGTPEVRPDLPVPARQSRELFEAPFIVVSHSMQADPIFNYANLAAMKVWEMDWDEFTRTPSRLSAEEMERGARTELMARVAREGFVGNFKCVRISRSGRRFEIENVTVWNVLDESGLLRGQAAVYDAWRYL